MIEFEELPVALHDQLEEIADADIFGSTEASTLYDEIRNSKYTNEKLAFLHEVPIELVQEIKELNLLADKKDFILSVYENNQEIVMQIINKITDEETADLYIGGTIDNIKEEYLNSIFIQVEKRA